MKYKKLKRVTIALDDILCADGRTINVYFDPIEFVFMYADPSGETVRVNVSTSESYAEIPYDE